MGKLSQSNAQCTHLEDSQMKLVAKNAPILRDSACDDVRPSNVTKPTEITEISKTIRLRTSHSQNTEGESRLSSLPSVISDDNIPTAAPKLACSTQSLSDCGRVSISSNSSDLEEIDTGDIDDVMNGDIESIDRQTFDDENYHLDGTTQSDLSYGEIADQMLEILSNIRDDKMSILETIADEISTGLSPIQELRGFTQALTTIISHHNYNTSEFESKYLYDRVLCDEVPSMVVSLLKRTCHFSDEFFEPENGPDGIQCIVQFFAVVVRLLGLFIQLDISHLKSSQSGEYRDLFSPVALSVAPSMLKQSRLYELIADSRPSIYSSFAGVLGSFLEPDGFLENVHLFATLLVEKTSIKSGYVRIATQLNILSASLLRSIHLSEKESVSTEICNDIKFTVPRRLSKYFITMENQLSKLLDLQLQALDLREFLEFLDSVVEVGRHLHNRVPLDGRLQDRLRLLVGQYRIALKQREVVLLGEATLRFPTFLKMLASSRMDFRLRGLNCMTDSLLNYWRNNSYDDWRESAVLRFVVDFLIVNKVVEYLVGPESHYELVRRCGNVPSFLLVSGSISTEILDALWQPVLDNRDPRVVQATLHMHGEMSTNMGPDHIVMLCGRISRIPFSSFDSYLMDLVGQLIERIRMIYEGGRWADLEDLEILEPYKMLIRLMRLASEQVESISVTSQQVPSNAFDIANRNLSRLVETGPAGTIRKQIFIDCVSNIREMNDHTTGNTTAILTILRRRSRNARSDDPVVQQDIHLLVHELELPQLLVKEISRFVNVHRGKTTSLTMRKLDSRLELLKFILNYSPQCLLKEEHAQLWKCIIGEEALGTFERDQGFEFYSHFATNLEFRSILDTIYCELFPKLHPKCFSPHVLDFCKNSLQYLNRTESSDETSIVEIKGIDQLWRIILTTSDEKLVNDVVDLLIWVYLESSWILQAAPCAVQATHFYIVERCISQLTSSAHYVVNRNNISGGGEIRLDHQCNDIDQATREYLRSLQILEGLVKGLRSNPRYIPRNTAKNVYPKGEPLIVRLRCNTNGTNIPEKTITMGIENTGGDLLFIISTLMSNGKNRVMLSGRELKQGDDTSKTLGELGFSSDRVLTVYNIQDPRSEKTMGDYSSDIVQDEIMRHFEALYSLLDLSEPYSLKAWLFLRYFPANALIKKHVMDPNISWGDLYPQNKPFKCLYSLYALSRLLSEQKSTMVDLTTFIRISVPRLIEALGHSDTQDFSELNFQTSLNLKSELLSCLAVLLQGKSAISSYSVPN
ncbi:hypothetical protein EDC01DRAFT_244286 [Geopyxis carbonaria]|nr:hypothetical protein EDC01DRAFT_244286 [Geopyxis carbonaria]